MIGMVVQMTAISLCLIAVVHYLYVFFKTTLTVPKVKDLVNRPQKQYDAIFKAMGEMNAGGGGSNGGSAAAVISSSTTSIASLPILGGAGGGGGGTASGSSSETAAIAMKQELKQFLKGLNLSKPNRL